MCFCRHPKHKLLNIYWSELLNVSTVFILMKNWRNLKNTLSIILTDHKIKTKRTSVLCHLITHEPHWTDFDQILCWKSLFACPICLLLFIRQHKKLALWIKKSIDYDTANVTRTVMCTFPNLFNLTHSLPAI